jgi:hypothetical protein
MALSAKQVKPEGSGHLASKSLDRVRKDLPKISEERERVNFNVPVSAKRRWKIAAVEEGRDLSDLVIEAVEAYLARKKD